MANKPKKHEAPAEAFEGTAAAAEAEAQVTKVQNPHEVDLTREDRERIVELSKEKVAAGLPHNMANESAERQVREDKCGLYQRVRNAFNPKSGAETAKA